MWRLFKNQGGSRQFNLPRYIQINKNLRNDSDTDSAINMKLTKSFREFLHKMTLTLDTKSKNAEDVFSSAIKKLEESLKKSDQFLSKEVDDAKRSVLNLAKIAENQLEIYSGCVSQYEEEILGIKRKFNERIKKCTEKTVIGLETVRSSYEKDLQEVRDLKKSTTRSLKECLAKNGNIESCIDEKIKISNEKYKNILEKLQVNLSSSQKSVFQLLKTASVCYEKAQSEVSKNLPGIVEKTKLCIENSKEKINLEFPDVISNTIILHNEKKPEAVLEKTIKILIELPNKNIAKEEKLECLHEAKKDALNTMSLVLHEIEASKKITANIKKSDKADPLMEDFTRFINEIVKDAKVLIKKCTTDDWKEVEADILKCLTEFFDSIKLKKFELMERVDALKKDNKKSSLEIDKALKWISAAEEKLQAVEKIFQECAKARRNKKSTMVDFFQQVQKIVKDLGEVVAQTVEPKWEDLTKFEENASSKVLSEFDNLRKKMRELSNANAMFKSRIEQKEAEIQKIESNMRNSLIECYKIKSRPVEKLQKERNAIHEEANKLKNEAQKMIGECLASEDGATCFQKCLTQMEKKAQKLLKKFQDLVKNETNTRVECTKLILECDKKAVNTVEKKISKIIDEITKSS